MWVDSRCADRLQGNMICKYARPKSFVNIKSNVAHCRSTTTVYNPRKKTGFYSKAKLPNLGHLLMWDSSRSVNQEQFH